MKKRNPIAVFVLSFVTIGIYSIYWQVDTKVEMNALGAEIPTAWLLIVPLVNIWWLWKYSVGVEKVTAGKLSGVLAFILLWLLGPIGAAIVQDSFNNNVSATNATPGSNPTSPAPSPQVAQAQADSTVSQPPTNTIQ